MKLSDFSQLFLPKKVITTFFEKLRRSLGAKYLSEPGVKVKQKIFIKNISEKSLV